MTVAEKHTLFMVSKFFTDGSAEVGRGNFGIARYYFERGEAYLSSVPEEQEILRRMILNVYHRSKSFYHYRLGAFDEAIRLIEETMVNNRYLERNGFDFLIYDRVQQYYNLSRIFFARGEAAYGLELLAESTRFLMIGQSETLPDLNDYAVLQPSDDIRRLRFSLLCQILFETTEVLREGKDIKGFLTGGEAFFERIFIASPLMRLDYADEGALRKWLLALESLFRQPARFPAKVMSFNKTAMNFYGGRPAKILHQLLEDR